MVIFFMPVSTSALARLPVSCKDMPHPAFHVDNRTGSE